MSSQNNYIANYLGIVPYGIALEQQQRFVKARAEDTIPDILMLLQHPPVFTVGRFRGAEEIIATPELLARQGIFVFHTNRGGSVTYHGLGQLVGYPIINLKEHNLGVREYVWSLEEVIIGVLQSLDIKGHRMGNYPGSIWVKDKKICSIGIKVDHYITMHGFALNVDNDLKHFSYINPCGIKQSDVMTSLSKVFGVKVEVEAIIENVINAFSKVFRTKRVSRLGKCLNMSDALIG